MTVLWRDGSLVEGDTAIEPGRTGWGVFSTVGCDCGRPFLWQRHAQRLAESVAYLAPNGECELPDEGTLRALLGAARLDGPARLRVVASWTSDRWRVEASAVRCDSVGPTVAPAKLMTERWLAAPPLVGHKTLSRLPWELALSQAARCGADDALLIDATGRILESTIANLWVIRDRAVMTPSAPKHCLPGIMRGWLLERIPELGLRVGEADITEANVIAADEVWLSNSVVGVRRVGEALGGVWRGWPIFDLIERLGLPAPGWPQPVGPEIRPQESCA